MDKKPMRSKEIVVVKIGGSLLQKDKFQLWIRALASYFKRHPVVLVHGGGKEVTRLCEQLGLQTKFVKGRRFTDERTMEAAEMVLSGKVNPAIVSQLNQANVPAVGLSGRDGKIVSAKRVASLGRVGIPNKIRAPFIHAILDRKWLPVFSSIADDGQGNSLNVNADEMASAIASALKARRLVLYTDVPGVVDAFGKTIPHMTRAESQKLIKEGVITGGMIPKINSSFDALKKGIGEIWILEGSLPISKARGTVLSNHPVSAKNPFK